MVMVFSRRTLPWLFAVLLSLGAVQAGASPSPLPSEKQASLDVPGIVRWVGRGAGTVPLRLTKDISLDVASKPSDDFRAATEGLVAGFFLTGEDESGSEISLVVVRFNGSLGETFVWALGLSESDEGIVIPRGKYAFYVFSQSEADMRIVFGERDGKKVWLGNPYKQVAFSVKNLTSSISTAGGFWITDAPSGPTFKHSGMLINAISAQADLHAATASGSCAFGADSEQDLPPRPLRNFPGCHAPVGNTDGTTVLRTPIPPDRGRTLLGHAIASWGVAPGVWSQGTWMATASDARDVFSVGVWLDLPVGPH